MTFHNRIFVIFVFDKISKGMLVTIEKELGEYIQWLHFWNQSVPLIKMNCRVRYSFDFDLTIRSGQMCAIFYEPPPQLSHGFSDRFSKPYDSYSSGQPSQVQVKCISIAGKKIELP